MRKILLIILLLSVTQITYCQKYVSINSCYGDGVDYRLIKFSDGSYNLKATKGNWVSVSKLTRVKKSVGKSALTDTPKNLLYDEICEETIISGDGEPWYGVILRWRNDKEAPTMFVLDEFDHTVMCEVWFIKSPY